MLIYTKNSFMIIFFSFVLPSETCISFYEWYIKQLMMNIKLWKPFKKCFLACTVSSHQFTYSSGLQVGHRSMPNWFIWSSRKKQGTSDSSSGTTFSISATQFFSVLYSTGLRHSPFLLARVYQYLGVSNIVVCSQRIVFLNWTENVGAHVVV